MVHQPSHAACHLRLRLRHHPPNSLPYSCVRLHLVLSFYCRGNLESVLMACWRSRMMSRLQTPLQRGHVARRPLSFHPLDLYDCQPRHHRVRASAPAPHPTKIMHGQRFSPTRRWEARARATSGYGHGDSARHRRNGRGRNPSTCFLFLLKMFSCENRSECVLQWVEARVRLGLPSWVFGFRALTSLP